MKLLVALIVGLLLLVGGYFGIKYYLRNSTVTPALVQTQVEKKVQDQVEKISPTPPEEKALILIDVPFTVQAPLAEWKDPRQQEACEEASSLMAMHWVKGEKITSPQAAKDEILAIAQYEQDNYGSYHDTSAFDTGERILKGYYKFTNFEIKEISSPDDIVNELANGHILITPMNGQALHNSNFTQPGPERHMLVVVGYDRNAKQFITNETGIRQGESWRYGRDVFFNAMRDYDTGDKPPITAKPKVMIVIKK